MVREKILNMSPGRELDAEITRKIFGEEVKLIDLLAWPKGYYRDGDITKPVPRYSTDISAAWEVVDKIQRMGILWTMENTVMGTITISAQKYSRSHPSSFEGEEINVEYDTAPEAICKAALLAVEGVNP